MTSQKDQSKPLESPILDEIIGISPQIKKIKAIIKKIAPNLSTVCINGESGTGKELFAQAIHQLSPRSKQSFIPVNCAAIPETLMESELFGYDEGAFTGAKRGGRKGKFELAHKGSLFLDEIADLQINLQSKLLRVLQEGTVEKVGGESSFPIDVRLIAATNQELHILVEKGLFREDLFYRLAVIPIHLPPLRERQEDILPLAYHFLGKLNKKMNKEVIHFSDEVQEVFHQYPWPGNIRELMHVVEYAMNMSTTNTIERSDLSSRFQKHNPHRSWHPPSTLAAITPIEDLIRSEITKALKLHGKSKKGIESAAKALGISPATLYRKLKENK